MEEKDYKEENDYKKDNKEDNKEERKNKIVDFIIKVILIIIIILLLLHNCQMIKKLDNNDKKDIKYPTGNVDVFELKCEKEVCKEVLDDKVDNTPVAPQTTPSNNTPKDDGEPKLTVLDNAAKVEWDSENEIDIFSNTVYEMEQKIAPECSNTYEFIVRNSSDYKIKYNIDFKEVNKYHINMKYRLRKDNSYVIGDDDTWVTYDELNIENAISNANTDQIYYLQWKWFSSENDSSIGADPDSKYKLTIYITAESQNE